MVSPELQVLSADAEVTLLLEVGLSRIVVEGDGKVVEELDRLGEHRIAANASPSIAGPRMLGQAAAQRLLDGHNRDPDGARRLRRKGVTESRQAVEPEKSQAPTPSLTTIFIVMLKNGPQDCIFTHCKAGITFFLLEDGE